MIIERLTINQDICIYLRPSFLIDVYGYSVRIRFGWLHDFFANRGPKQKSEDEKDAQSKNSKDKNKKKQPEGPVAENGITSVEKKRKG